MWNPACFQEKDNVCKLMHFLGSTFENKFLGSTWVNQSGFSTIFSESFVLFFFSDFSLLCLYSLFFSLFLSFSLPFFIAAKKNNVLVPQENSLRVKFYSHLSLLTFCITLLKIWLAWNKTNWFHYINSIFMRWFDL